jgi:hypothetical protein
LPVSKFRADPARPDLIHQPSPYMPSLASDPRWLNFGVCLGDDGPFRAIEGRCSTIGQSARPAELGDAPYESLEACRPAVLVVVD